MPLPALGLQLLSGLGGMFGNGSQAGFNLAPPSASEQAGSDAVTRFLPELGNMVGLGPGASEVRSNLSTQNDLAAMLQRYAQGGFMPGAEDFTTAGQFANSAFQPQQVAINQQFQGEQLRANQLAARLGRPVNDPIIQSRLSQERQQAQERLGADQSAFTSQFALSLPQQRLGYQGQLADLRSGLASQAMSNRQALVSLGNTIQSSGQNFRLGSAQRQMSSGGGTGGGIAGLIAGIGATKGGGLMDLFNGGGGNSGNGSPAGSGSMFGLPNLNSSYGFGSTTNNPFGSSNMFGQLTGKARGGGIQPYGGGQQQQAPYPNSSTGGFVPPTLLPNVQYPQGNNLMQMLNPMFGGGQGPVY